MQRVTTKVTSADVADYFLAFANETGDLVTNMKLQKLVYYAQAWFIANKKKALFDEEFEAWVHGPVIPTLYRKYKIHGFSPIIQKSVLSEVKKRFDKETLDILEEVTKAYMQYSAYQMELMTHQEAPWIEARKGLEPDENSDNSINKDLIKDYYGARLRKTNSGKQIPE